MNQPFTSQSGKVLTVGEKTRTVIIKMETITYLNYNGYNTVIYLSNYKKYHCLRTLKSFEDELASYGFLRLNRNALVNALHINEACFKNGGKTVTVNGTEIPVSRRRVSLVRTLKRELDHS